MAVKAVLDLTLEQLHPEELVRAGLARRAGLAVKAVLDLTLEQLHPEELVRADVSHDEKWHWKVPEFS